MTQLKELAKKYKKHKEMNQIRFNKKGDSIIQRHYLNNNGEVTCECWLFNGKLHHTCTHFCEETGQVLEQEFFQNGVQIQKSKDFDFKATKIDVTEL